MNRTGQSLSAGWISSPLISNTCHRPSSSPVTPCRTCLLADTQEIEACMCVYIHIYVHQPTARMTLRAAKSSLFFLKIKYSVEYIYLFGYLHVYMTIIGRNPMAALDDVSRHHLVVISWWPSSTSTHRPHHRAGCTVTTSSTTTTRSHRRQLPCVSCAWLLVRALDLLPPLTATLNVASIDNNGTTSHWIS